MKALRFALCAAVAAASIVTLKADMLAEQNYAFGGIGLFSYGDEFSGTGFALEGGVNYNIIPQLDAIGSLRYYTASKNSFKWSELDIGADAAWWFMPGEKINPYAGGGLFLANFSAEVEYFGQKYSDSETKIGLKLFGGAEFIFVDKLILRAGLTFKVISDNNDVIFDAMGAYEVTDELLPYGKFEYWFDSGNVVFIAGAMFKF